MITGERGDGTLTRYGIEEYVSDCVIVLDHRVSEQTSTRRLRILKYRGSLHGTNEYPFLIGESGISVLPITVARLAARRLRPSACRPAWPARRDARRRRLLQGQHRARQRHRGHRQVDAGGAVLRRRVPPRRARDVLRLRGVRGGDRPQHGLGRHRPAGAGWTPACCGSIASARACSASRGTCSPCRSSSASSTPPWSSWTRSPTSLRIGSGADVSAMLTRQVDFLKASGVTALFTSLNSEAAPAQADQQIASLVDTWLLVKTMEGNGELNRLLYVLKSRGMAHSNQIREFLLTDQGIELADVYVGPQGVLTGSARQAQEAQERSDGTARLEDLEQRRVNLETPARGGRGADRGAVARVRGRGRQSSAACSATARPAPRIAPASAPSRAGSAAPTPTSPRTSTAPSATCRRCVMNAHRSRAGVAAGPRSGACACTSPGQSPKSLRAFANLKTLCEEHLRRALRDRDHRPRRAAGAGPQRRHRRDPDARPPPPDAAAQDHRRPLQHRTRPGRPPHPAPEPSR